MIKVTKEDLVKMRKDRGLTQKEMAEVLKLTERALKAYEYGERSIGLPIAEALMSELKIDPCDIFTSLSSPDTRKRIILEYMNDIMPMVGTDYQKSVVSQAYFILKELDFRTGAEITAPKKES